MRIPTQTSGASAGPQPPSVRDLFQQLSVSEKEELLFIQLPDTIPVPVKALKSDKSVQKSDAEDKRTSHIKAQVSRAFGTRSLHLAEIFSVHERFIYLFLVML